MGEGRSQPARCEPVVVSTTRYNVLLRTRQPDMGLLKTAGSELKSPIEGTGPFTQERGQRGASSSCLTGLGCPLISATDHII